MFQLRISTCRGTYAIWESTSSSSRAFFGSAVIFERSSTLRTSLLPFRSSSPFVCRDAVSNTDFATFLDAVENSLNLFSALVGNRQRKSPRGAGIERRKARHSMSGLCSILRSGWIVVRELKNRPPGRDENRHWIVRDNEDRVIIVRFRTRTTYA